MPGISDIVTRGYGSHGSVTDLPTRGYGTGTAVSPPVWALGYIAAPSADYVASLPGGWLEATAIHYRADRPENYRTGREPDHG